VVREPRPVDLHGFTADLAVERTLAGPPEPGGARLRIAWEELARARPPRFADGQRIAVALDPLPGASLWRSRFPKGDVWVVAAAGEAFLRDPDAPTLAALERYLALPLDARSAGPGIEGLASLAARAPASLALAAVERLAGLSGLARELGEPAQRTLSGIIEDPSRPVEVRRAVVTLVGRRNLVTLRDTVDRAAAAGSPTEAEAVSAQAEMDGGLSSERGSALLARANPAVRALVVRRLRDPAAARTAAKRLLSDPAPEVRAAAVQRWIDLARLEGFDAAAPLLNDPAPPVRAAAAEALGRLGAPAVPRLQALAQSQAGPEALGALLALSQAGAEGHAALQELSTSHPDEQTRRTAGFLATGKLPGH
jgi:hypothetical protein